MLLKPATPLAVLLFAAFALLLLSVLSTPIIKAVPLATYKDINFGVFGWCRRGACSHFTVGYSDDARDGEFGSASSDGDFNLPASIRHTLSSLLIVHPIAAFLTLVCFGLAAAAHLHAPSHSPRYLLGLLVLLLPTLLVSLLAFLVDILLFVPHLQWGGWIVLAATVILTVAGILTCAMRRTLVSRKARKRRIAENAEMNGDNFYARQLPPAAEGKELVSASTVPVPVSVSVADSAPTLARYDEPSRPRPHVEPHSDDRFWAPSEPNNNGPRGGHPPPVRGPPYRDYPPPGYRPDRNPSRGRGYPSGPRSGRARYGRPGPPLRPPREAYGPGQDIEMAPAPDNSNPDTYVHPRSNWARSPPPMDARSSPNPLPRDMTRSPNTYYEDVEAHFTAPPNPEPPSVPPALTPGPNGEPQTIPSHDAVRGIRSPVSDASHFTSISQRGVNPNWQPPERDTPREKVQRQREAVLDNNPDFNLGVGVRSRSNSARRGDNPPQVPAMPPMPSIPSIVAHTHD